MTTTTQGAIEANRVYTFTKSGSEVRAIEPAAPYLGQPCWTVERTDGISTGKRMTAPACSLKSPN